MPAGGGEARPLTKGGGFKGFESAEGQFFYYQKTRNPTAPGIWRVPVEGGEEELAFDQQRAGIWRQGAVTQGGIYFVGGEYHPVVIVFHSLSGGGIREAFRPEKDVPTGFLGLSLLPDGNWLLYTQEDQTGRDIMLVENIR